MATRRLTSLDGLRGVAALIVVVHHAMLVNVSFADTYLADGAATPVIGSWLWWFTATPIKLLTAGGEAVTVFFVLSGIVLTLPVLASDRFDWVDYFPRRLTRLWVPAAASVALAAIWTLTTPQVLESANSWWVNRHTYPVTTPGFFLSATDLITGNPLVNNPLWSLRWEVIFSLALPVFVLVALFTRRRSLWWLLPIFGATFVGDLYGILAMVYLPAFLAGSIIAGSLDRIRAFADRMGSAARAGFWGTAFVLGAILLISYWLVRPLADAHPTITALTTSLSLLGAVLIVLSAAFWAPFASVLDWRITQWLGRISFSLYLVHVPIILAAVHIFGSGRALVATAIAVVVAIVVAEAFARFVEMPAHRLSRRVGTAASTAFARGNDRGSD